MKKIYLLLYLCLPGLAWAQNELLSNVTPPSPDVAALGKFVDVPVNLYTGAPSVDIPIYQIQAGQLSIPISLSYHASGIKVAEISSNVGLGWALQAGGSVSRSIRGLPDEGFNGFFSEYAPFDENGVPDIEHCVSGTMNINKDTYFARLLGGCYDTEPDKFFFSMPGKSGKFVFDRKKQVHLAPYQPVAIQAPFMEGGQANVWTITTEDGIRYRFSGIETTHSKRSGSNYQGEGSCPEIEGVSTWHLTQIISPLKDTITLAYTPYTSRYQVRTYAPEYHLLEGEYLDNVRGNPGYQDITVDGQVLTQITSSQGHRVEFSYGDRLDLEGGKRLTGIHIYHQWTQHIKSYELAQSYFTSGSSAIGNSYANHALRLDAVQEYVNKPGSLERSTLPAYQLTYQGDFRPGRENTNVMDQWGYYNGDIDLNCPKMTVKSKGKTVFFNERPPHPEQGKAGILTQIQYPTGGTTQLEYELHECYSPHTRKGTQQEAFYMDYEAATPIQEQSFTISGSSPVWVYVTAAQVPTQVLGDPFCYLKLYKDGVYKGSFLTHREACERRVLLEPGAYTIKGKMQNYNCGGSGVDCVVDESFPVDNSNQGNEGGETNLPQSMNFSGKFISLNLWWEREDQSTAVENRKVGGYRIQKMTMDPQQPGGQPMVKFYQYLQPDGKKSSGILHHSVYKTYLIYANNGTSVISAGSGDGLTHYTGCYAPVLGYNPLGEPVNDIFRTATYLALIHHSNAPMTRIHGSHIGYRRVIVLQGTKETEKDGEKVTVKGHGGKTVYLYDGDGSAAVSSWVEEATFPLLPERDITYRKGLLRHRAEYKYEDGKYYKVREADNHYEYVEVPRAYTVYGFKIGKQVFTNCKSCEVNTGKMLKPQYAQGIYIDNLHGWNKLKSTTETVYSQDTTRPSFQTTTRYEYDPVTLLPKTVTTDDLDGKQQKMIYKYPLDYAASVSPAIAALQAQHIWTPVLEERQELRGKATTAGHRNHLGVRSGKITTYREKNSLLLPDQVYLLETDAVVSPTLYSEDRDSEGRYTEWVPNNLYRPRARYERYDDEGNILEVSSEEGIHESYVWGYGKRYMVAKLTHATQAEVAAVLGSDPSLKTGLSEAQRQALRTQLPHALVTTYTYTPLVGITSETGPDGRSVYYEYDAFHRLELIKDHEGNIVQHAQYHYSND